MKTSENTINQKSDSKWLGAGLVAAVAASLCCITPALALFAGVGGVAATFSWLEPFRPYLIGMTILVLGFAWYQKLKPRTKEEIACDCEEDGKEPFFQSKKFLGVVTISAIILLSFPSYSHIFYPDSQKDQIIVQSSSLQLVNLEVKGMTCTGCEEHVKHVLAPVAKRNFIPLTSFPLTSIVLGSTNFAHPSSTSTVSKLPTTSRYFFFCKVATSSLFC